MRQGVLSDFATKSRYPENFPLDLGLQTYMHPLHLPKHNLKGIKNSKKVHSYTTISRFPSNDLRNFATFGNPDRQKESAYYAIMNYRKQLGSSNVLPNLENSFQLRNSTDFVPIPPVAPQDQGGVQAPAVLQLGRYTRAEGERFFTQGTGAQSRNIFSARMRATMANLGDPQDLLGMVLPEGLPQKMSDDEVLGKLRDKYADDIESTNNLERAYMSAGRQNLPPLQDFEESSSD